LYALFTNDLFRDSTVVSAIQIIGPPHPPKKKKNSVVDGTLGYYICFFYSCAYPRMTWNIHVIDTVGYSFPEYESQVKGNGNESMVNDLMDNCTDPSAIDGSPIDDPVLQFMHVVPSTESRAADDPPEVFLPGLVIHLIRLHRGIKLPLWKHDGAREEKPPYRAILADRENFKEILISPNMFLDHLPWRCVVFSSFCVSANTNLMTVYSNGFLPCFFPFFV